ncbi:hypothetical protein Pmani_002506 [Petrolisthes manimaculis]|uniref:Uncharacterized protein n=1 Tax=Petrolisthes manimaculis TaxID=1843537 RepID=A0AAE1QHZ6_9EUCA|nr:hypothetical protein Pmani_002506 [Petrolisthes manimaculis]
MKKAGVIKGGGRVGECGVEVEWMKKAGDRVKVGECGVEIEWMKKAGVIKGGGRVGECGVEIERMKKAGVRVKSGDKDWFRVHSHAIQIWSAVRTPPLLKRRDREGTLRKGLHDASESV